MLSEKPSQVDLSFQIAMKPRPELYLEFLAKSEALVECAVAALALKICQVVVCVTRICLPKGQCSGMSHCHWRSHYLQIGHHSSGRDGDFGANGDIRKHYS